MEKINDTGVIPPLEVGTFKGRKVYFKRTKLMMGIFKGVGISQSLLEKYTEYPEIVILFLGSGENDKEYRGLYLAKMDDFRNSKKKFANAYNDVQRFLSFSEMEKVNENAQ